MSFKLLAIRPLADCNTKFLKNLEENRIYKFYNDYEFKFENNDESNEVISVEYNRTIPENFYGNENISINVSAIVGKNGSGKSSLVELLYAFVFYLSREHKLIKDVSIYNDNDLIQFEKDRYKEELEDFKKLNIEVFYEYNSVICRIKLFENEFSKFVYTDSKNDLNYIFQTFNNLDCSVKEQFLVDKFFYSIVINYSLYGLNTNTMGVYLKTIFHKNDGYQTPIVLNPMRTNGIINVNSEYYLSKSRLLASILMPIDKNGINKLRELVNGKIVNEIKFEIEKAKFSYDNSNNLKAEFTNLHKDKLKEIFIAFKQLRDGNKTDFEFEKNDINSHAVEYVLRKIDTIANRYLKYSGLYKKKFNDYDENQRIDYFNNLAKDTSHITFKLRQAINFLKYNKVITTEKLNVFFDIDYLTEQVFTDYNDPYIYSKDGEEAKKNKTKAPSRFVDIIDLIPPSFFKIDFKFKDNKGTFNELSSGECQKIYSLYSIIYHIMNLVSNFRSNNILHRYDKINIVFDEVELYFHPEMQRTFIKDLLDLISKSGIGDCQLNIIFITHSPFILSDIPKQNILFLEIDEESEKSKPIIYEGDNTFGANIHEMLINGFFIESTKGEFVLSQIKYFLEFYQEVFDVKESDIPELLEDYILYGKNFKLIINLIGEIQIKTILENHIQYIEKKLRTEEDIGIRISKLEEELELLRNIKESK